MYETIAYSHKFISLRSPSIFFWFLQIKVFLHFFKFLFRYLDSYSPKDQESGPGSSQPPLSPRSNAEVIQERRRARAIKVRFIKILINKYFDK